MNDAHLHLLINHLPIIGAFLSVPLLILALIMRGERGALRAAVLVVLLTGLGAGGALLTGEPAEEMVEHRAGTDETALEEHEERAELAAVLAGITTLLGLGALVLGERRGSVHVPATVAALVGVTVTAGAMAWTGEAGGQIRHSELRDGAAAADAREGAPAASGVGHDDD